MDRTRMVQIEADVTEDLGGSDAVSGVMSALVADFAFAVVLRDLLAAHLAATGPLTRAGKKKAAYTTWLQASQRVEGLARQIGTGRKAAKIQSVEEFVRERAAKVRREHEYAGGADDGVASAQQDTGAIVVDGELVSTSTTGRGVAQGRVENPRAVPLPGVEGIPQRELEPDEVSP